MKREERILRLLEKNLSSMGRGDNIHVPRPAVSTSPTGEHLHPYPEIFIQLEESSLFHFSEGDFLLKEGHLALIPPLTPHPESVPSGEDKFQNLVLMASPHQVSCHLARARKGRPFVSDPILRRTRRGEKLIVLEQIIIDLFLAGKKELLSAHLDTLLFYLMQIFDYREKEKESLSDKVVGACSLINVEMENPDLNVVYLAERLGCSRDYLSHIFRREMGEKLTAYINRERILRAKALLKDTKYNSSETAWACGFSHVGYFNRLFKEQTGFAPLDYRRKR